MSCCRCNRMGRCQNCCCVKQKRHCTICLPLRLGNCANLTTASVPSVKDSSTASPARAATVRPVATTPPTSAQIDIVVTTPTQTATTPPQAAATNLALSSPEEVSPRVSRPDAQAETDSSGIPDPPKFIPPATPKFTWGDLDAETFIQRVDHAYSLVVHWKRNIFSVPSGKVGTSFVSELSRLFCAYAEGTALESIALKAAMTSCALLLQKPNHSSKTKDHIACLERRMSSWKAGDIDELLSEGLTIQR